VTLWRLLDVVLLILGAGAVVMGVAQVFPPAAWIVGGLACIALGILPLRRT
jgi:hypothetical protein